MSEESQILVAFGSGIQTVAPQADIAYAAATSVIVYNGQTSTGLTATANKSIEVYGVVNSTTVASGGMLNVWAGGSAYSTLVNNGRFFVYNNGKAVSTNQTGGQIHLDGGFMDAAKIDGGVVYVSAGGSARYVDVNSGGMVIVSSGGAVSSSYVNAGGHLSANRGARVVSTLVKSGGYLYANDGANVTFTTVRNGGNLHVRTGGSVTNATINSGGNLYVMGGTAYVHGIVAEQGARLSMGIGAKTDIQGTSAGSAFSYGSVVRGVDVHSNLTLTLRENGSAVAVTVTSGGQLNATSGGTAVSTTVNSRGVLNLDDYGVAVSTTVNSNGHIYATDGGTAVSTINRGGYINVSEGGSAVSTTLESNSWLDLFNGGSAVATTINGGHLMVSSGGTALSTTFNAGWMKVSNGGAAVSTMLANDVWLDVCDGGTAIATTINSGHLVVSNNGTVSGTIVNSAGQLVVSNGGTARDTVVHSGGMFFAGGGILHGDVVLGGTMTLSATANAANAAITFDVSDEYRFDDGSVGTGKTVTANGFDALTMLSGNDLQNYSVIFENTAVADIMAIPSLDNLVGDESGLSWSVSTAMHGYVVEYSQDDFTTAITIETATTGLSHYNMASGLWQWRVRPAISSEWTAGEDLAITINSTDPTIFAATTDDVKEAFFVQSQGIWNGNYQAQHVGIGEWSGTNEVVPLNGKNAVTDIFNGSEDANVLLMTDDANGDALFIDDIYSAFPEGLDAQARIAKIDEIRAGDGNDIVDLTSQRFDYIGGGMTVHGGLGNDTIWANDGDNALFGDAGNDRIVGAGGNDVIVGGSGDDSLHGGGGEDIFAFGSDWGNDNVEQLADGKVTLWFEEGSLDKWDVASLTYRDGDKSVAVSGVAAENISLKFGDDGSEQYGKLLESGAFDEFSSERIFENKNSRGMLA